MRRENEKSRLDDGAMTNTAVVPALSSDAQLRIGGPIRRGPSVRALALETFCKQCPPRRMGPGVRRDDDRASYLKIESEHLATDPVSRRREGRGEPIAQQKCRRSFAGIFV